MAALPKRKSSSGRRDRRRLQDKLATPAMSVCPKCKKTKRPHFACTYCGYYGKSTKKVETKEVKE